MGKLGSRRRRDQIGLLSHTKISSEWMKDANIRPAAREVQEGEENMTRRIESPRTFVWAIFGEVRPKNLRNERKIDTRNYSETLLYSQETEQSSETAIERDEYRQTTPLTGALYTKYAWSSPHQRENKQRN